MMFLPILIIIILVYFFLNSSERGNNIGFKRDSKDALDILDRRFANGEISEEEYLRRKAILKEK